VTAIWTDIRGIFNQFFAAGALFAQGNFVGFVNGDHLTGMAGQKASPFGLDTPNYETFISVGSDNLDFGTQRTLDKIEILKFVPGMKVVISPYHEVA